jgi:hypothetical protein
MITFSLNYCNPFNSGHESQSANDIVEGFLIALKATNRIVDGISTLGFTDGNAHDSIRFNWEGD